MLEFVLTALLAGAYLWMAMRIGSLRHRRWNRFLHMRMETDSARERRHD